MKKLLLTVSALILSSSLSFADIAAPPTKSKEAMREEMKAQMEQVKTACAPDVAAAGCSGEAREVMKCMREYKKNNKEFKFSEGCREAMKDGHEMRKERKMARKAHKKHKMHNKSEGSETEATEENK